MDIENAFIGIQKTHLYMESETNVIYLQRERSCIWASKTQLYMDGENTVVYGQRKTVVQSNFNGSNIFGTMENCSRHG